MAISLKNFENHNLVIRDGVLVVRDAFASLSAAYSALVSFIGFAEATTECIGGFTVSQINTSEILHYLFFRKTTDKTSVMVVCTEQFQVISTSNLGTILDKDPIITHAIQNQQITINSPSIGKPFWGYVGGSVVPLEKLENIDIDDPAIEAPNGICCSFGDRVAVANGNIVFFTSPDFFIRTYTGANTISMPGGGKIFDMFQGNDGNLYIFCSNGIYYLTRDALDQGVVFGSIGNIKGYHASSFKCAVQVGGAIFAPDNSQMAVISGDSVSGLDIVKYNSKRYLADYVGAKIDFRKGKMFATNKGWAFIVNGKICVFDKESNHLSWHYADNGTAFDVVGILTDRDGETIYVHKTGLLTTFGNVDGYTTAPNSRTRGTVCVSLPSDPEDSNVVRFITTASDNVGTVQVAAIRAVIESATTPAASNQSNLVDGNEARWNNGIKFSSREVASRRHGFAVRTDNIEFEVSVLGSGAKLEVVSVQLKGQGRKRSKR